VYVPRSLPWAERRSSGTRGRWVTVVEANCGIGGKHYSSAVRTSRCGLYLRSNCFRKRVRRFAHGSGWLGLWIIHYDKGTEQFRWVLRPRRNRNFGRRSVASGKTCKGDRVCHDHWMMFEHSPSNVTSLTQRRTRTAGYNQRQHGCSCA